MFGYTILIVMCMFAQTLAMDEEMAELARMVRESCIGETGADINLIEKVNAGADLMPDAKLKCYIKCVMETGGVMSEGVIDIEAVLTILPEDFRQRNENNLRACGTKTGSDDCDTAYLTQECWQKSNKADYFLI